MEWGNWNERINDGFILDRLHFIWMDIREIYFKMKEQKKFPFDPDDLWEWFKLCSALVVGWIILRSYVLK